jgi:hypothetical protein
MPEYLAAPRAEQFLCTTAGEGPVGVTAHRLAPASGPYGLRAMAREQPKPKMALHAQTCHSQ